MSERVKSNYSPAWWAACLLGAVDGLLIGFIAEGLRLKYETHQIEVLLREVERRNLKIGYLIYPAMNLQIPIICLLAFTLISPIVLRYLVNRPQLLLSLWFGLGGVAMALGYFMSTMNSDLLSFLWLFSLVAVAYFVYRIWRSHPESLPLAWAITGISAFVVVAVGVQFAGLFFYWRDLRRPLIWLIGLLGVIAISTVLGGFVQFILNRIKGRNFKEANAQ